MKHPLQEMMERRRNGEICGIPSYCSANELVLEQALRRVKELNAPTLIEATANQVNQFGGYTGMVPQDFYNMVMAMAEKMGVAENMIILAGDHLGPLTWQNLPEKEAMDNSIELVYQYTKAGFTKIHLDTSMKVADDPEGLLSTETIARRGAILYKAAIKGYEELKATKPEAIRPVFIIGSEVPIPGGAQEEEDSLAVTSPAAFKDTVATYKRVFAEEGIADGTETSTAAEIVSAIDIQALFAGMKVGTELVEYVATMINNIYDIVNRSGVQMLIFLAGLQSISPAIYESCSIDGATGWETFWKITFPMISPMILVNAVYTIIDSFTTDQNTVMKFIDSVYTQASGGKEISSAMAWMYFMIVILIVAAVAGIASAFVFYQKKD